MKNKIVFIGSLCAILALGLVFAGCDEEAQLVKLEYSKLSAPGNVTATVAKITTTDYQGNAVSYDILTVKWDAVSDATSYQVVITRDDKKTIYPISYSGSGSPVQDNTGAIADLDKWEATISGPGDQYGSSYTVPKGTWKVGVIANTNGYGKEPSDPAWASGTVTITTS